MAEKKRREIPKRLRRNSTLPLSDTRKERMLSASRIRALSANIQIGRAAVDDMLIFEFYQDFVEKFLHAMPCSETLSRMDKDPEDSNFLLLKLSVAFGLLV